MFGDSETIATWSLRGVLALLIALLMLPGLLVLLAVTAVAASPIALVGIPFMLPAFFGSAEKEHRIQKRQQAQPAGHRLQHT